MDVDIRFRRLSIGRSDSRVRVRAHRHNNYSLSETLTNTQPRRSSMHQTEWFDELLFGPCRTESPARNPSFHSTGSGSRSAVRPAPQRWYDALEKPNDFSTSSRMRYPSVPPQRTESIHHHRQWRNSSQYRSSMNDRDMERLTDNVNEVMGCLFKLPLYLLMMNNRTKTSTCTKYNGRTVIYLADLDI